MLLPALPPKTRQLLRRKNHCCVRFLNSEILSVFMLEKNAPFWTTFLEIRGGFFHFLGKNGYGDTGNKMHRLPAQKLLAFLNDYLTVVLSQ